MGESRLMAAARQWVIDRYPYNREHLLRSLEWLDRVAPGSAEAVRLATLTHDMERAFPGPDQPQMTKIVDAEYERLHSERSARIVGDWLREQHADEPFVAEVERLIRAHEVGGWTEADLVQAADRLSFLDTNIDLFLDFARSGRFTLSDIRQKFEVSRDRIRVPHLRELAAPMAERALERLHSAGDGAGLMAFRYLRPRSIDEVISILEKHGPAARLLAGGTDLLVRLRTGHIRPEVVVDLKRVAGLTSDIAEANGVLRIGARAVMTDLMADDRVRRDYAALVEAAAVVGSVQIRNRATLAGNICNASPAADTAPALLAYGAAVNLVGPSGTRQVALAGFFTGPGRTVLQRGELVESIDIPRPSAPTGGAFGRVTRRRGVDLATINLVIVVTASGEARCAFGAVAPRPIVAVDTSGALGTRSADPAARRAAWTRVMAEASPISDVRGGRDYRQAMLDVMAERTWTIAMDRLDAARQKEARS